MNGLIKLNSVQSYWANVVSTLRSVSIDDRHILLYGNLISLYLNLIVRQIHGGVLDCRNLFSSRDPLSSDIK